MSKKIVIVGGGYAGIRVATSIMKKKGDFEAYLIDNNDYHTEKTCLHEVAAGQKTKEQITYSIKDSLKNGKVKFIQDEVLHIDKENRVIELSKNENISFDYLVIALGFESETFGIEGVNENALSMVNVEEAEKIYNHIINELEEYKKDKDKKHLKFVIAGAGFTGIELLGAMAEQLPKYGKKYGFEMKDVELSCVEAAPRILPMFSEKLAEYAVNYLKKLGANILLNSKVKRIEKNKLIYENDNVEKELSANTIIWTTGVSGSHTVEECGFEGCKRGRVLVKPDLTIDGYDDIFMIGDVAAVIDEETNRPYPTTAQIALAMSDTCAYNLISNIRNKEHKNFKFKPKGTICSLGNCNAIGVVGKIEVKGYIASVLKKIIETRSIYMGSRSIITTIKKGRFDLYR